MAAGLFLEVFAGSARLTAAFRANPTFKDKVADPWDIIYGKMYDLLVEANLRKLLNLLASGHIAGTLLEPRVPPLLLRGAGMEDLHHFAILRTYSWRLHGSARTGT